MTLSAAIDAAKDQLGSYEAVAKAMDTSTANVTRWKGGQEPKAMFYEKLTTFFEIDIDELGALIVREQQARYASKGHS